MNETLHIILIILAFTIMIGWSIFDWLKIGRKLKSKKLSQKKQGMNDLKNYGNENIFMSLLDIIKKIF